MIATPRLAKPRLATPAMIATPRLAPPSQAQPRLPALPSLPNQAEPSLCADSELFDYLVDRFNDRIKLMQVFEPPAKLHSRFDSRRD